MSAFHEMMGVYREIVTTARTLVVKIGTNVLSQADDTLDDSRFDALAAEVHHVRQTGRRVVLVSSGAIGAANLISEVRCRIPRIEPVLRKGV